MTVAAFTHDTAAFHCPGGLQKRSMRIAGHRTSIALEPRFWAALEAIARLRRLSIPALFAEIERARAALTPERSLASAARVHALLHRP